MNLLDQIRAIHIKTRAKPVQAPRPKQLNNNKLTGRVYELMADGAEWDAQSIQPALKITSSEARSVLRCLYTRGWIERVRREKRKNNLVSIYRRNVT